MNIFDELQENLQYLRLGAYQASKDDIESMIMTIDALTPEYDSKAGVFRINYRGVPFAKGISEFECKREAERMLKNALKLKENNQ